MIAGSHVEVVLKPGQQARLIFKKPIPSENPICVIVNYDIGADENGKTSYGESSKSKFLHTELRRVMGKQFLRMFCQEKFREIPSFGDIFIRLV